MRMHAFEREVAIDEAHPSGEACEQELHRRRRLLAVGTLEVAVLDDRDRRVRRPEDVVGAVDRERKLEQVTHRMMLRGGIINRTSGGYVDYFI
jgi:hypothetical protein